MAQTPSFETRNFVFTVRPGTYSVSQAREVGVAHDITSMEAGEFYFREPRWNGIERDEVTIVSLQAWLLARFLYVLQGDAADCEPDDLGRIESGELAIALEVQDRRGTSIADLFFRVGRSGVRVTGQADSFMAGSQPVAELEERLFSEPNHLATYEYELAGNLTLGWDGQAFPGQSIRQRPERPSGARHVVKAEPCCEVFPEETAEISIADVSKYVKLSAFLWASHAPSAMKDVAGITLDHAAGRDHPNPLVRAQLRVSFDKLDLNELFEILKQHEFKIRSYSFTPSFSKSFWKRPPADCVGALLQPDGGVAVENHRETITPISEPFYVHGRPELNQDDARGTPHLIAESGIPIVSQRLLETLRQLGCEGQTADVVYRGHNKKKYDSVQPGFKRFLPAVHYPLPDQDIDILPREVPEEFGACAFLRTSPYSDGSELTWYDLGVAISGLADLRKRCRNILLKPVFRHGGEMHALVCRMAKEVKNLSQ